MIAELLLLLFIYYGKRVLLFYFENSAEMHTRKLNFL